jgi:hypothetical protein
MLSKEEIEAKIQSKMDRITGVGGIQNQEKFDAVVSRNKIQSEPELLKKPEEQINRIIHDKNDEASSGNDESSFSVESGNVSNEKNSDLSDQEIEQLDKEIEETQLIEEDNKVPEIQKGVKNYAERKINKVTAKLHNAHDEIQELKLKLKELQERESLEFPENVPTVNDDKYVDPNTQEIVEMPRAENFGQNMPQYFEAVRNFWTGKGQALNFWKKQQKLFLENQKTDDDFVKNLKNVQEENIYKDFNNIVTRSKLELIDQYQPQLGQAIKQSKYAPHLLYGICKDLELQKEFLSMNPIKALVELGKMEAEMELVMRPNVVSKAPAPIQQKHSSGARKAQSVPKDASSLSQREFNARIKEKMRQNM